MQQIMCLAQNFCRTIWPTTHQRTAVETITDCLLWLRLPENLGSLADDNGASVK